MAFRKVIFPGSTPLARDFGAFMARTLSDGRIAGAEITYAGGTLSLAVGYLLAGGRIVCNNAAVTASPSAGTGVAQWVLVIDASGDGSVAAELRTAASESELAALVRDDINDGSGVDYEVELALVDLAAGALTRSLGLSAGAHAHTLAQIADVSSGSAEPGTLPVGALYLQYEE